MRNPTGTPLAATALVVAGLLATQAAAQGRGGAAELDVSAVAIAASTAPVVSDEAFDVRRQRGRDVATETTATATSDCDGCSATGVAVTVSYVTAKETVRADNVSSAWSSCTGCRSQAVSVQVVVLHRAATLRADNRALAAAVACTECATSAVAYQLVVVSEDRETFDEQALDELRRWAREQAGAQATTQAHPERRSVEGSVPGGGLTELAELERHAEAALGPITTLHRDVDVVRSG